MYSKTVGEVLKENCNGKYFNNKRKHLTELFLLKITSLVYSPHYKTDTVEYQMLTLPQ